MLSHDFDHVAHGVKRDMVDRHPTSTQTPTQFSHTVART
jgi:hypothetical protein